MKTLSNLLPVWRRALRHVVDALVPQDCFLCGLAGCGAAVCEHCAGELRPLPAACPRCAVPTVDGSVCGACQTSPLALDRVDALHEYVFPIDKMVWALKFRHRLAIAAHFAMAMQQRAAGLNVDAIVPMPLHLRRLRSRGYNQAVLLARPLARHAGVPLVLEGVVRVGEGPPQEGLSRKARWHNVRHAFACQRRFDGQSILLVDDVMTTGASLDALAKVLKQHGARRVEALIVARTPAIR